MLTAIVGIISLITLIIKLWVDAKNEKSKPKTSEQDIQTLHNSLAKGDADTLSSLFDELRRPASEGDRIGQNDKETS